MCYCFTIEILTLSNIRLLHLQHISVSPVYDYIASVTLSLFIMNYKCVCHYENFYRTAHNSQIQRGSRSNYLTRESTQLEANSKPVSCLYKLTKLTTVHLYIPKGGGGETIITFTVDNLIRIPYTGQFSNVIDSVIHVEHR